MKRLFLFDVHLGNPFFDAQDEYVVMELIVKSEYDELIIGGDFLDVWEQDLRSLAVQYRGLLDIVNNVSKIKRVYYLLGNHDPEPQEILRVLPNVFCTLQYYFDTCVAFHGHQYDYMIRDFDWLARLTHKVQWVCERLGFSPAYFFRELLHSISLKRQKKYHNDLVLAIEKEAVAKHAWFKRPVVMGHTHIPKITDLYINGGDWTHNRSYVVEADGKFELVKV